MIESVVSPAELRARRLIFTHDGMPGYRRRRNGKGFSYLLPDGSLLRDASERQRIVSLVIPPAYEAVWICTFPNGHLQATGIDSRGRKQYRYHPDWHALAADKKFELLPAFVRALPRIRRSGPRFPGPRWIGSGSSPEWWRSSMPRDSASGAIGM